MCPCRLFEVCVLLFLVALCLTQLVRFLLSHGTVQALCRTHPWSFVPVCRFLLSFLRCISPWGVLLFLIGVFLSLSLRPLGIDFSLLPSCFFCRFLTRSLLLFSLSPFPSLPLSLSFSFIPLLCVRLLFARCLLLLSSFGVCVFRISFLSCLSAPLCDCASWSSCLFFCHASWGRQEDASDTSPATDDSLLPLRDLSLTLTTRKPCRNNNARQVPCGCGTKNSRATC